MSKFKKCLIDGCEGNAHWSAKGGKGWCCAHYKRWLRHGDPLSGGTPHGAPLDWLINVALSHEGDECLIWPFAKSRNGYAKLSIDGRDTTASNYVCERVHGAPPTPEHESAHSCGDRGCVNRHHITWKTPAENNADKLIHGTHNRGERHNLAKLTESQVIEIRSMQGGASTKEIAEDYGVSETAIYWIFKRKNWAWLDDGGVAR